MKDVTIKTTIRQNSFNELDADVQMLINEAIAATANSYAPYSHFNVGAALRLENGTVIKGANQENASYPVCMCAERSAIFNAQSSQPDQPITAIAIAAKNGQGLLRDPVTPCGVCRQAILEIEQRYGRNIRLYLYGTRCVYVLESVKDILPLSFTGDAMR